jgi:hypothetical protein
MEGADVKILNAMLSLNGGCEIVHVWHEMLQASPSSDSSMADISSMTNMMSFVRNEFENHILSLVYIMFLILITTLLSLNAHGIITNHRESVFIGIAAGFRSGRCWFMSLFCVNFFMDVYKHWVSVYHHIQRCFRFA